MKGDTLDETDETFHGQPLERRSTRRSPDGQGIGTITDDDALASAIDRRRPADRGQHRSRERHVHGHASRPRAARRSPSTTRPPTAPRRSPPTTRQTSGTLTFTPGQTSKTITVPVKGDTLDEPDETLHRRPLQPRQRDARRRHRRRHDHRRRSARQRLDRRRDRHRGQRRHGERHVHGQPLGRERQDGHRRLRDRRRHRDAARRLHRRPAARSPSPPARPARRSLVPVKGDTLDEPDETFTVGLSSPTNATLADATGAGTITDDDGPPGMSIGDVTVAEGNSGTTTANFTVTLAAPSANTVSVAYATADGIGGRSRPTTRRRRAR